MQTKILPLSPSGNSELKASHVFETASCKKPHAFRIPVQDPYPLSSSKKGVVGYGYFLELPIEDEYFLRHLSTINHINMGYWPSLFSQGGWILAKLVFFMFMDQDEVKVHKLAKKPTRPISSHLDRTNLVNKGFIIWLLVKFCLRDTAGSPGRARWLHLARSGSQSQRAIWFILPARGASHIISMGYWPSVRSRLLASWETQGQLVGARGKKSGKEMKRPTFTSKVKKAFFALLVNIRRFISLPDLFPLAPTNCPWVSEDGLWHVRPCLQAG